VLGIVLTKDMRIYEYFNICKRRKDHWKTVEHGYRHGLAELLITKASHVQLLQPKATHSNVFYAELKSPLAEVEPPGARQYKSHLHCVGNILWAIDIYIYIYMNHGII